MDLLPCHGGSIGHFTLAFSQAENWESLYLLSVCVLLRQQALQGSHFIYILLHVRLHFDISVKCALTLRMNGHGFQFFAILCQVPHLVLILFVLLLDLLWEVLHQMLGRIHKVALDRVNLLLVLSLQVLHLFRQFLDLGVLKLLLQWAVYFHLRVVLEHMGWHGWVGHLVWLGVWQWELVNHLGVIGHFMDSDVIKGRLGRLLFV